MSKWTQCRFKRGENETVAWIDSKAAKKGNYVELLTLDGNFWEVIGVGTSQDEDPTLKYRTWNNNI